MAMMDNSPWNGQDHPMHASADDDFQQLFGITGVGSMPGDLSFDFHDFQPPHNAAGMDTPMSGTAAPSVMARSDPALQVQHPHAMPPMTSAANYQNIPTTLMPPPTPDEALVDSIDAQIQFLQQQKLEHQHRQLQEQQAAFFAHQQSRIVPPTPQSLELAPGSNHFYQTGGASAATQSQQQQQQQALDYRYRRLNDDQDMSFTPLVSPAVTPLETHFPMDAHFTVPGTYFSPLTSPALHAQTDPNSYDLRHKRSPPFEMDMETSPGQNPMSGASAAADSARRSARKPAKPRAKPGVGKSPITKPLRRRTANTPTMNAQALTELVEVVEGGRGPSQHHTTQLPPPAAHTAASSSTGLTDSENGSVSPQALTDVTCIEMPPPPVPKPLSGRPSPCIAPQNSNGNMAHHPTLPGMPSPATPASLMMLSSPSIRNAGARAGSQEPSDENIESFQLPESVAEPARVPAASSRISGGSVAKPPSAASASASPIIAPGSGMPQSASAAARRTPQLLPRGSRKRASISSVHVSPALRPKISPNIKPLLPGGQTAEEAASHLLATKSNYQRILEGNTVPGVTYPSELSTNLTSKRTSHKIAEQGRRNRINSALQEMATLLPVPPPKEKEAKGSEGECSGDGGGGGGGGKKDKGGSVPNSKASTVEMAIEYIKQLKKELSDANRRAEAAEKKLALKESG